MRATCARLARKFSNLPDSFDHADDDDDDDDESSLLALHLRFTCTAPCLTCAPATHSCHSNYKRRTGLAQYLTSCHDPGSSGYPTAASVRDFLTNSGPVAMAPNARAVVAAKRYCAESAVAVQTKILNYRHGVAPPATWPYETFSDLMASGAREVPKQKTARQWARRWQARWGVARKTLPAHEDLSQEAVQEKAWF